MAAAVSNGLPVTSIMGFVRGGDNGIMVPADSGWKTLKDVKGKRIAVPAGSATAALFDAFLKAGGLTRDDVVTVNLDSAQLASVYVSGGADAALTTVAYMAPIVADRRPSSSILFSSYGLNVPGYGLVVRTTDLDPKAAVFKAFVGAQQKTWDYIFAGHADEAIDAMMAERAGNRLDRAVILGQLKAYMPLFTTEATKGKPLGWQADADWESAITAMKNVGLVKPQLKPADFYTNRYITMN
jgi:NitT/TauT family transport system substrate-binding protein